MLSPSGTSLQAILAQNTAVFRTGCSFNKTLVSVKLWGQPAVTRCRQVMWRLLPPHSLAFPGSPPFLTPHFLALFKDHSGLGRFVYHLPAGWISSPWVNVHRGAFACGSPTAVVPHRLEGLPRGCQWPVITSPFAGLVYTVLSVSRGRAGLRARREAPVLEVSRETRLPIPGAGPQPTSPCHPAGLFSHPPWGLDGSLPGFLGITLAQPESANGDQRLMLIKGTPGGAVGCHSIYRPPHPPSFVGSLLAACLPLCPFLWLCL